MALKKPFLSHKVNLEIRACEITPLQNPGSRGYARLETTWYSPESELGLAPHCTVTHLATGEPSGELKRAISHREGASNSARDDGCGRHGLQLWQADEGHHCGDLSPTGRGLA